MDKDTKWLIIAIVLIIFISTIGYNYDNFKDLSWNDIFKVKTFPKDDKPKDNDLDRLLKGL